MHFAIFTHPAPSCIHGVSSKYWIPVSNDITFPFPSCSQIASHFLTRSAGFSDFQRLFSSLSSFLFSFSVVQLGTNTFPLLYRGKRNITYSPTSFFEVDSENRFPSYTRVSNSDFKGAMGLILLLRHYKTGVIPQKSVCPVLISHCSGVIQENASRKSMELLWCTIRIRELRIRPNHFTGFILAYILIVGYGPDTVWCKSVVTSWASLELVQIYTGVTDQNLA